MSLVDWKELPVRVKRSRKRLYSVISDEFSLDSWMELPIEIKRSKKKLYDYIANELNIDSFEELPIECRRSTRLMYTFIQENGGGGSTPTLTVVVTDGADPITGATVTVDGDSETTGSDGKATFTLEYGDYEATISAVGYTTKTEELKFRSNKKSFSITLESSGGGTGTLTVTALDSESQPLGDVNVYVSDTQFSTVQEFMNEAERNPSILLGYGYTDAPTGECTICEFDVEHLQPTDIPLELEYGTHYLYAYGDEMENGYVGSVTIDSATNTKTITLTTQE